MSANDDSTPAPEFFPPGSLKMPGVGGRNRPGRFGIPKLDRTQIDARLQEAQKVLGLLNLKFKTTSSEGVCDKYVAAANSKQERAASIARRTYQPWRNQTGEHLAYRKAASDRLPILQALAPTALCRYHAILLDDGEMSPQRFVQPGQIRDTPSCMANAEGNILEVFSNPESIAGNLNELATQMDSAMKRKVNPVLLAAILHYQFIAIHPFVDGNGRLVRLLAEFLLIEAGAVSPALPISIIIEPYRPLYFARLHGVTVADAWEDWINFFCAAIIRAGREVLEAQ